MGPHSSGCVRPNGQDVVRSSRPPYYFDPPTQSNPSRDLSPGLSFEFGHANPSNSEHEPSRNSPSSRRPENFGASTKAPGKTSRKRGVDKVSSRPPSHESFHSEGKEVNALLINAVAAICADDRETFGVMKAEVKELVSNTEMGL